MEKVKEFMNSKKFTYLLVLSGALGILLVYAKNIPQINAVWELVDEYGYLANAAYLSGTDWAWVSNLYYGYGYSIWLIPLFWVCNSGTRIIQGAVAFNTICVVAIFFVQNALMCKICKQLNKNIIVAISFILCFYPYLFASEMKVIPESLLVLMIWVCGLLLYQALNSQKWYYYMLLAIATVYTFFVHTRALVFCAAVCLTLVIMFVQKKVDIKNRIVFCISGGLLLLLGFALKNNIIDAVYSNVLFESATTAAIQTVTAAETVVAVGTEAAAETVVAVGNTVTLEYMLQKIIGTFTNFSVWHVYSFACKNFYLFVSTAGMFHIGIYFIAKEILTKWKQKLRLDSVDAVKFMYGVAATVMIVALIIQTPGSLEKPTYFFYGRYYEYLVGPIAFIGLQNCLEKRLYIAEKVALVVAFLLSARETLDLEKHLATNEFYFDSNRIASFSYSAHEKIMYGDVIQYWLKVALVAIVIVIVLNYFKRVRGFILLVLLTLFLANDIVIEGNTLYMHQANTNFYEIATFIHSNYDVDEVYFLNGDFVELTAYAGIQSLLGQEELILIEAKDADCLETGDLLVTYGYNSPIEQLEKGTMKVGETKGYAIYVVE